MDIKCIFSYSKYNEDKLEERNRENQQVQFWISCQLSFLKTLRWISQNEKKKDVDIWKTNSPGKWNEKFKILGRPGCTCSALGLGRGAA